MKKARRILIVFPLFLLIAIYLQAIAAESRQSASEIRDDPFSGLPLVLEINTAKVSPIDVLPAGCDKVETILGREARVLPPGPEARRMVYRVGIGKQLKAGATYLLEIEYPDEKPRTFFMANRGADFVRGWATGMAVGDPRRQYVEPSVESLAYPQTGQWHRYRQLFVMQERLQGVTARRNPDPGVRPFTPEDGFHLVFFQTYQANDPRSEGSAIGTIRLYSVPEPARLYAPLNRPPRELPQRRVFWREEMSDQAVSGREATNRAFADPLAWYAAKIQLARMLGIDTFCKDLLEFGFNQGWESGDQNWVVEAQPPLKDLWTRLVPMLGKEQFQILPYYEYKGGIGLNDAKPRSLAWQRRAQKLYHGIHKTADSQRADKYTGTWWAEEHNADLTDPDTLADFERILDRTIFRFKDQAQFAGIWLRTRHTHLPISFSDATVGRFRADLQDDPQAQNASRAALIASYEGDRKLYDLYIEWWLKRRARFLESIGQRLKNTLGNEMQVLFTPWINESVPELLRGDSQYTTAGLVTDDPAWWNAYASRQTDSWFRWKWVPNTFQDVLTKGWWARSLALRRDINDSGNWGHAELYHSSPGADPDTYRQVEGAMMTYPIGRMFTVAGPEPISSYRAKAGLSVVHHFTLNENDDTWDKMDAGTRMAQPFQNVAGYVSADCDRAGPASLLGEAKAIALADPRNLAFLCAANFSTGFPAEWRRFIQAFVAVPALPSRVVPAAASDAEVVLREVATEKHGIYYFVVNPTWHSKRAVRVSLPAKGTAMDAVSKKSLRSGELILDLAPAELRSFHVIN